MFLRTFGSRRPPTDSDTDAARHPLARLDIPHHSELWSFTRNVVVSGGRCCPASELLCGQESPGIPHRCSRPISLPHPIVAYFRHYSARSVSHLIVFAIVLTLFRMSRSGSSVASGPFWPSLANSPPRWHCAPPRAVREKNGNVG
jgi:hypothetical protein